MRIFQAALLVPALLLLWPSPPGSAQSVLGSQSGSLVPDGTPVGSSDKPTVIQPATAVAGRIVTERSVYYSGEALSIGLLFDRGAALINEGTADAWLVIFAPLAAPPDPTSNLGDDSQLPADNGADEDEDGGTGLDDVGSGTNTLLDDAIFVPVSNEASDQAQELFAVDAIDISSLTPGTYQLGVIVTNPGGDPRNIDDWFEGLLGLSAVRGLTIAEAAVDLDADGDGFIDNDTDGDGFVDASAALSDGTDSDSDSSSTAL